MNKLYICDKKDVCGVWLEVSCSAALPHEHTGNNSATTVGFSCAYTGDGFNYCKCVLYNDFEYKEFKLNEDLFKIGDNK